MGLVFGCRNAVHGNLRGAAERMAVLANPAKILYNISMIEDCYLSTQDQSKHLVDILNIYEFLDCTPFGIKEE